MLTRLSTHPSVSATHLVEDPRRIVVIAGVTKIVNFGSKIV